MLRNDQNYKMPMPISFITNEDKEKDLIEKFKNKSNVVKHVKEAITSYPKEKIAKILLEVVNCELNHYWDIDGGFEAMALLQNSFNDNFFKYFKERVKLDPEWRFEHALNAISILYSRELKEALVAYMSIFFYMSFFLKKKITNHENYLLKYGNKLFALLLDCPKLII